MSRSIPHRELRNNSSAVLREVQAGETLTITNHGEVVAMLIPPPASARPLSLRTRKATNREAFAGIPSEQIDHPIQETLNELRGER